MKYPSLLIALLATSNAFVPNPMFGVRNVASGSAIRRATTANIISSESIAPYSVRAPLKYLGPYPALSLRFPDLTTSSQRERKLSGVSLDFILDTAANLNTLNGQVAHELALEKVGTALPGLSAGGAMAGGETYLLGNCELEGSLQNDDSFTFMTNLTASVIPVANPAAAGLLSLSFLQCFPGGVEFSWGKVNENGNINEYPSITFHDDSDDRAFKSLPQVKITPLAATLLPTITVTINGNKFPALLDTGSPITVLNAQAAQAAGVDHVAILDEKEKNSFAKLAQNFKQAQGASRGDVLTLAGNNGRPVQLVRSTDSVKFSIPCEGKEGKIDFGESKIYVGDLPGLKAVSGDEPAVVLGMDLLTKRSKMWFRGQQNEVSFYD